ncbi:MAG: thiamine diphosphokinase [Clostridia bacterium]|nr:thiamine diphosphokinase [Clostridia bacterium]
MRALIITPLASEKDLTWVRSGDLILCADGGYEAALALGLKPDRLIGDMDSRPCDQAVSCPVSRYPVMKDETDTVLCIREGIQMGAQEFIVLGGLGGRLDHTYANLQTMAYGLDLGVKVTLTGQGTEARLLSPGQYTLAKRPGMKLSLFAYTPQVTGLTLEGMVYPLQNASLDDRFPLGFSNGIAENEGRISFSSGELLVFFVPED